MKKYFKTTMADATHIEVMVYYDKGGMNYFTSLIEPRGIYVMITPVRIWEHDGYTTVGFSAFSGFKTCVMPLSRRSQKKLDEVSTIIEDISPILVEEFEEDRRRCYDRIIATALANGWKNNK